jgi:hypothetical protein
MEPADWTIIAVSADGRQQITRLACIKINAFSFLYRQVPVDVPQNLHTVKSYYDEQDLVELPIHHWK